MKSVAEAATGKSRSIIMALAIESIFGSIEKAGEKVDCVGKAETEWEGYIQGEYDTRQNQTEQNPIINEVCEKVYSSYVGHQEH